MSEFIPPASRFIDLPSPFAMRHGGRLHGARIACETWGVLDAARTNAILIHTGLSPDAHAASHAEDPTEGWWERMIGPGRPIDTGRWFVVCVNTLGSCKGSTGPASIDPTTGAPYRLHFPELAIEDCADAAAHVVPTSSATVSPDSSTRRFASATPAASISSPSGAGTGSCQISSSFGTSGPR